MGEKEKNDVYEVWQQHKQRHGEYSHILDTFGECFSGYCNKLFKLFLKYFWISSASIDDHLYHLCLVLQRLKKYGKKIKQS